MTRFTSDNEVPLNIIVIGTGMYTCGRGTKGYGTILPAIYEWKRRGKLGVIYIVGAHAEGIGIIKRKIKEMNRLFGFDVSPRYFPEGRIDDKTAYLSAIRSIGKPACAIISIPDHLHAKIAERTVRSGLHTLVVKPLAPTLDEVKKLARMGDANDLYCAVEYHKRFDRANMMLKDVVARGDLGDILYILVEYSQRKSVPSRHFKDWAASTNIFQYLGVHYLDVIYYITGATPLRAMAVGQKNHLLSKGINNYDSIQATVEWISPSGKIFNSSILTNWVDPELSSAMSDQKIKVIGTKGRFESDQKRRGVTMVTDSRGVEEPNPYFCVAYGQDGDIGYKGYGIESICQFLEDATNIEKGTLSIKDLEGTRPTFRQSIVPTKALEAVNKSLRSNGRWIKIGNR